VALDVFCDNSITPNGLTLKVGTWEARALAQLGDDPNIATMSDRSEEGQLGTRARPFHGRAKMHVVAGQPASWSRQGQARRIGSECLIMPDTRPGQLTARHLACSARGRCVP
jgi:hypothetical protein